MKPPLYFLKNTQHFFFFFLFFQYSTKSVFLKLPVRYCSRLTLRAHLQDIQKNVFKHKQTLKKNQVKTVTPVIWVWVIFLKVEIDPPAQQSTVDRLMTPTSHSSSLAAASFPLWYSIMQLITRLISHSAQRSRLRPPGSIQIQMFPQRS